jgi:hypothetical protein
VEPTSPPRSEETRFPTGALADGVGCTSPWVAEVGWRTVSGRSPVDPTFCAGGGDARAAVEDCSGAAEAVG